MRRFSRRCELVAATRLEADTAAQPITQPITQIAERLEIPKGSSNHHVKILAVATA